MKRVLSWLRSSPPAPAEPYGSPFRPALESLDERTVPNATSWVDTYHPAHVSAVTQERVADSVSFAIGVDHRLIEYVGDIAFHPGAYKGAVVGGFATDIDAGRDLAGYAQCLVHGAGNTLSLYNVKYGWTDLSLKASSSSGGFIMLARNVWQISAGNTGELYMLDTLHQAWKYEFATTDFGTAGWHRIGTGISEIQASDSFFDPGLYVRTDSGYVGHYDPATSWTLLGTANPHAKALSVNANDNVFIIAGAGNRVYEYSRTSGGWGDTGGAGVQAINAVTGPNHEDLVYGFVGLGGGDIHGQVDLPIPVTLNSRGTGRGLADGTVWKWTAESGWQDLRYFSDQFSGASGSTIDIGFLNTAFDPLPVEYRNDWATGDSTFLGHLW